MVRTKAQARRRILITGASGFIGRLLTARLAERGHQVRALYRSSPPSDALRALADWQQCDLSADLTAFGDAEFDTIIHLAWGGLPHYHSLHHITEEGPRQLAFLESAIKRWQADLIVTGTCFEYGMIEGVLDESMAHGPQTNYGMAKDILRRQLEALQRKIPYQLTWARLFYMYGSQQAPTSLYRQLKSAVEANRPTFPMSGGEQLRDFLPVSAIIDRLVLIAEASKNAGIINLCSGRPVSVRGLVERWLDEHDWQIALDLGHYPYPDYEPFAFWGSDEKFEALYGASDTHAARDDVVRPPSRHETGKV